MNLNGPSAIIRIIFVIEKTFSLNNFPIPIANGKITKRNFKL